MPELPDVELYVARLGERLVGSRLNDAAVYSAFALHTTDPPFPALLGKRCTGVERMGKRIVLCFEEELYAVVHLMIAGRFTWKQGGKRTAKAAGKILLATFDFESGSLGLQEMGTRKRATIHVVRGRQSLAQFDRGGLDVFDTPLGEFSDRIRERNRTLKRTLTDPATFDGIGNAYSDEILFAARLSPVRLTSSLTDAECERLQVACPDVLGAWRDRLQREYSDFPRPSQITAFREGFAVHGKFGQPCPTCGAKVQRIVYAENETNYCARCQNEGRLLADRALSRLLKSDWPRTLEQMDGV